MGVVVGSVGLAVILVWPVGRRDRRAGRVVRGARDGRGARDDRGVGDDRSIGGDGGPAAIQRAGRGRPVGLAAITGSSVVLLAVLVFGWTGLAIGVLAAPVAATGTWRWSSRQPAGSAVRPEAVPLLFDLFAAALRAGAPVVTAVRAVAEAADRDAGRPFRQVAALLDLGADTEEAWQPMVGEPRLAPLAAVAMRSARSGMRLADGLELQAIELRAQLHSEASARAQRAGTFTLLPLGLCFLPAFVALGIVPTVVGIAGSAFASLTP